MSTPALDNFRLLGRSGLRVSPLCLGTMTFGTSWEWGSDKSESEAVFSAYRERGGNFIDTANYYTNGESEAFLGEFLQTCREEFVLATKYSLSMRPGDPNAGGNHRKSMMQAIEGSLRRLKTDYIDLYWLHIWEDITPVEEIMRGLDDLVSSGKVLYIGISDTPAWRVSQANTLADLRGWSRFVGLQIEYSLLERSAERDLLPMAEALGLGTTPWSPLGSGILTGKYTRSADSRDSLREKILSGKLSERNLEIAQVVDRVATECERPSSHVALAWALNQQSVVSPIIGARTPTQLKENLDALQLTLSNEHLQALDDVSSIELGFPHDFLAKESIVERVRGGTTLAVPPRK